MSLRNDFENKINIVIVVACTQNERNPKTNCEKEKHIKLCLSLNFLVCFLLLFCFFTALQFKTASLSTAVPKLTVHAKWHKATLA